jgi:hypothetical protein
MARRDYFYDPEAPKPNSIRPATAVALFDPSGNGQEQSHEQSGEMDFHKVGCGADRL